MAEISGPRNFPPWLRKPLPTGYDTATRDTLRSLGLNTVCKSAECPNLGECWHCGTATFLICGSVCTRNCAYCAVAKGSPAPLDPTEPDRVAEAAQRLKLRHVVVTSVTRDDLPDGGAAHFAATIRAVRRKCDATVEVLVPDFRGSEAALETVAAERPEVFNHNIETVARLFPSMRPGADYARSLRVLETARRLLDRALPAGANGSARGDGTAAAAPARGPSVKSGLMVGMGETPAEVASTLADLRSAGCDFVTIGQYLSPSRHHAPVAEYVTPERFDAYAETARSLGFSGVASGPFVRSSYRAAAMLEALPHTHGE